MRSTAIHRDGADGFSAWSRGVALVLAASGVAGCPTKANPLWAAGSDSDSTATTTEGTTVSAATTETTQTASTTSAGDTTSTLGTTSTPGTTSSEDSSSTGTEVLDVCDNTDPDLVACYDFVGSDGGTVTDRSMYDHHGTTMNVQLEASPTGQAARVGPEAQISVPDGGQLELTTAMTLEAWVWLDSVPMVSRYGVIDKDGQYSLIVVPDQGWRCGAGGEALVGAPPETGRWSHVACVYGSGTTITYVDGVELQRASASTPLATDNTDPLALGDASPDFDEPLDGRLDVVRIWRVALSPQEICEAAGGAGC